MQGSFQGSLRQYYTITSATSFSHRFTYSGVLGDAYASLKTAFAEIRVHSLRVYVVSDLNVATDYAYASCLIDSIGKTKAGLTYGQVLSMPGSSFRRMYQGCGHHWKWTEPSDAEFNLTNSDVSIADFYLSVTNAKVPFGGHLVVDISVTLRDFGGLVTDHVLTSHPLIRMILETNFDFDIYFEAFKHLFNNFAPDFNLFEKFKILCDLIVRHSPSSSVEIVDLNVDFENLDKRLASLQLGEKCKDHE